MKKRLHKAHFLVLASLMLSLYACRESFDEEFRQVPIINNPPVQDRDIDPIELDQGFETFQLDLAAFVSDVEGDPISYSPTSSDVSVVTVVAGSSILTFTEGGSIGISTIDVVGNDGTSGNDVLLNFTVEVVENEGGGGGEDVFILDFEVADGTTWTDLDVDGATLNVSEQDAGASQEVAAGELVWTMDEFTVLNIDFDNPIDISANPIFQFDYADLWNGAVFISISDADGGAFEVELGDGDFVLDDGSTNTYSVDLADQGLNLAAISSVVFEKFEGPGAWRMDNFILGPAPEVVEPVFLIDFEAADGTAWTDLDVAGALLSVSEQDEGASQEVAAGELVWVMNEFTVLNIDFDDPIDISGNPIFQFDYADLWNGALFISISDADGGAFEVELGDADFVLEDPSMNTYTIDLTDQGLDLSAISSIVFEKFEGPGEFRMDNFILGL